jgi:hypothetical protein
LISGRSHHGWGIWHGNGNGGSGAVDRHSFDIVS